MVNVRMAQHHGIQRFRIEREIQVALVGVGPTPLVHAALQQDALAVDFDQEHGAGDILGTP